MKTKFKLLIVGACLALATMAAQAQLGQPSLIISSGTGAWTNYIAPSTTFTTNAVVDCTTKKDVFLQWKAELNGAGTTANTLTIQGSADGSNWFTYGLLPMTPAGTTAVTVGTNMSVGALPYLRVRSIANAANTGSITNYTVRVFQK